MSSNGALCLAATFERRARDATRDVKPDGQCIINGCLMEIVNILEGTERIMLLECKCFRGTRGSERLYICDELGCWTPGAFTLSSLLGYMGE